MQESSRLAAERGHTESGDPQERQPAPFLKKAGWYAVAIASVALLAWLPWHLFGIRASVDVEALHTTVIMVSLGISLTIIVIGWSSLGGRTRADTLALIRAFIGIAILSAAYLLFTGLAQSDTSTYAALADVLHPGMGLTVATGMLAASYLPNRVAALTRNQQWIAALPVLATAATLALSCSAALVPGKPLPAMVGITAGIALFLYGWAGLRVYQRFKRDREDDLVYLLAAIATGMLAESLLFLAVGSAQPRHLIADLYRLGGFVLTYSALFHQVARGPYIDLQRAEASLRTEQERLARARQIAKLGSWEWDLRSDAVWTSDEVRHMFGIPADKISMTRAEFVDLVFRDDRERLRAAVQAAVDQDAAYSIDYRILGQDGAARTMHSEAQLQRDITGEPLRMAGIVQDISDRVAVEHALQDSSAQIRSMNLELENRVAQRTRQLAAANKELEAFSYSVSHDLQAPLRRIERYAQLLAENNGARMDDTGRDMLQHIQVALSQTKQLIADILKLSQVTRAELHHDAVDLSAMARCAIDRMERATSPARQVEICVEPGIVVQGDAALLQILLDNLLGNAWKFTARTEQPSIRVGSIEPAQGKGFYIKDNGAGFDMRYAHKLFSAFQRLHGQEDFKGTGIGLAIVQRIVNLHGWQIQASSETGRGATFTIRA